LHICGLTPSGNSKNYEMTLRKRVMELCIEDKVLFEGYISDMSAFRKKMNIELLCATREAFGLVTVEAMRAGLVVIGSNTGGTCEIINDGFNGLLYNQKSTDDLAEKILYILENPEFEKKISDNAKAFSKNSFTIDQNVKEIDKYFKERIKCLN
jgi:glycosyltransferase involved in cell wall biosynthesis